MSRPRVAAAILAGGRGQRMGGLTKSLLPVGGVRIIDRQLAVIRPLFAEIVIVAADPTTFAAWQGVVPVISDRREPGLGPLAGLEAALTWLPAGCESVVCVAGDMPFLAPRLLEALRDAPPPEACAVVPQLEAGGGWRPQPLCARYHRSLAPRVAEQLNAGRRAMRELLQELQALQDLPELVWMPEPDLRGFDPALASFININTPADLDASRDLRR